MAITEAQRKARVILFVGDCDAAGNPTTAITGVIATNIDLIWDTYDSFSLKLRELYARRDAILIILGKISLTADTAIGRDLGLSVRKSERAKAYQKMLDAVNKQIIAVIGSTGFDTANLDLIAQITQVTPVMPNDRIQFVKDLR